MNIRLCISCTLKVKGEKKEINLIIYLLRIFILEKIIKRENACNITIGEV